MTIFNSAYDTTTGRVYAKVEDASKGIMQAVASDYFKKSPTGVTLIETKQNVPAEIPTFTHPLYIDKTPYDGLYVDVRAFTRYDRNQGRTYISSVTDWNFQLLRAHLEQMWREESFGFFKMLSPLPASAYSGWLTQGIAKNFGLNPEDQYILSIITAHFFFSFFTNDETQDESSLQKEVALVARATNATVDKCFEVLDGMDYIRDLQHYVDIVKERFGPIVSKLDIRTLITMMIPGFWITNKEKVVAAGLEHMPTFYAMVFTVIHEDSHKRSRLAEVVKYCPAKRAADSYATQLSILMKDHVKDFK